MFLLPLLATLAQGATFVPGLIGGFDFSTEQPYTGLDLALHPDRHRGLAPVARATLGYGFTDARPLAFVEGGAAFALPREGPEIVRVGALLTAGVVDVTYRLPLEISNVDEDHHVGLIPGFMLLLEFEYGEERPFIVGARLGMLSAASNASCPTPELTSTCATWYPGLSGGFFARGQPLPWLYFDALIGPSPRLSLGVPF